MRALVLVEEAAEPVAQRPGEVGVGGRVLGVGVLHGLEHVLGVLAASLGFQFFWRPCGRRESAEQALAAGTVDALGALEVGLEVEGASVGVVAGVRAVVLQRAGAS